MQSALSYENLLRHYSGKPPNTNAKNVTAFAKSPVLRRVWNADYETLGTLLLKLERDKRDTIAGWGAVLLFVVCLFFACSRCEL